LKVQYKSCTGLNTHFSLHSFAAYKDIDIYWAIGVATQIGDLKPDLDKNTTKQELSKNLWWLKAVSEKAVNKKNAAVIK
jgi:hypothetical protein